MSGTSAFKGKGGFKKKKKTQFQQMRRILSHLLHFNTSRDVKVRPPPPPPTPTSPLLAAPPSSSSARQSQLLAVQTFCLTLPQQRISPSITGVGGEGGGRRSRVVLSRRKAGRKLFRLREEKRRTLKYLSGQHFRRDCCRAANCNPRCLNIIAAVTQIQL